MELLTLKAALSYAENGYPIIPLYPNTKIPYKTEDFSNGFHSATTDQEIILNHWNQEKNVSSNIGLRVGKDTGIVILDIDTHNENGYESLEKLENHFGKLPATLEVSTPSGGKHYWFKYPPDVTIQRQVNAFMGIDILVDGYVVAPPSHIDGKAYKRISGKLSELAEFPQFLLDTLEASTDNCPSSKLEMPQNQPMAQGKPKYTAKFLTEMVEGSKTGGRNDFVMRFIAKCLSLGTDLDTIYTLVLVVNDNFIDVPLDEKEVNTIFKSIVKKHLKKMG
ncbi:MAG: bifunctional DNA primase/polymerase [Vagococcus salmoninarum]|uniref:bifunctional DNA primase/polymerase n=1 Tax=Vagococcus salmoninarum TaxID=2739 RepID=UPI003F96EB78